MGTHGKGKTGQKLFGSVTYSVIASISIPTMVIPEEASYRNPGTVALGCDFRLIEDFAIFDRLLDFLRQFKSELHLVHVAGNIGDVGVEESYEAQKLKDFFSEIGHYIHELSEQRVETGLQQFIERNQIDILALVPRKHSLLHSFLGHSVTKTMTMESAIPILALPC
jgi:hypothetical protein